jgi:hypothetical protein
MRSHIATQLLNEKTIRSKQEDVSFLTIPRKEMASLASGGFHHRAESSGGNVHVAWAASHILVVVATGIAPDQPPVFVTFV